MTLHDVQAAQGGVFAPDGIPLHFGDQQAEYRAALESAVLLDRSHEARLAMTGGSALELLHRISTNDLTTMNVGEGRPTIFTNANARILDRVEVFCRDDSVLLLGEPGRGQPLGAYLQRNIFFGDDVQLSNLAPSMKQFDIHGPSGGEITGLSLDVLQGSDAEIGENAVYVARRKPVSEQRWTVLVPEAAAEAVWTALVEAGAQPAGSLVYNVLRVRAGLPSVGRELSTQFIPLEVGLWDEVSFKKGCYTGQEIIARMESRNRLAKTIVTLELDEMTEAPTPIFDQTRVVGQLTSSVQAPDGAIFALGVIKPDLATAGQTLTVGDNRVGAVVKALALIKLANNPFFLHVSHPHLTS